MRAAANGEGSQQLPQHLRRQLAGRKPLVGHAPKSGTVILKGMPARIRVDRFRLTQLPRVLSVEGAAFPHEAYDRQIFLDLYQQCGGLFYVVRQGRPVVGYMVTCISRRGAEIVSIAVHPASRGHGAGAALMRQTLRRLKQLGIGLVTLMVRVSNASAIRFYCRFGFERVRRVPRYYGDGADGLLYRLRLQ
jgi:[ribosomal protein S18]-alanine N-acetyltransferase